MVYPFFNSVRNDNDGSLFRTVRNLKMMNLPSGHRSGYRLYTPLLLAGLLLLTVVRLEAHEVALRIALPQKTVVLEGDRLTQEWSRLDTDERRMLLPYLLEYGEQVRGERSRIQELLRGSGDPLIHTYSLIVAAMFKVEGANRRRIALRGLQNRSRAPHHRRLVDFYMLLEAGRAGTRIPFENWRSICGVPGHGSLCTLNLFGGGVERLAASSRLSSADLNEILQLGRPLLAPRPIHPPFFTILAASLPDQLFSLGLPLEAAILADRIAEPGDGTLLRKVPRFLSGAADFHSALRYLAKNVPDGDVRLNNARLDWMILAGQYQEAIRLILEEGPDKLASGPMANEIDFWTGFRYRPEVFRLRLALLLYLAGDVKKAARALERLREFSGTVYKGEPEKYFARLRLAQILIRDNPRLSQKIAEDTVYIAQANEWHLLEYQATLLNGWAHYFLKNYYQALVAFTKSQGILGSENARYDLKYSRLLGVLAVRNKMRPGGNHSRLIDALGKLCLGRPYNEAIYMMREWMPRGTGPDFFLNEAITNLRTRGDDWAALNLLLEFQHADEHFFQPGDNPGGSRGVVMSVLWSRELARFSYLERAFPSMANITSAVNDLTHRHLPPGEGRKLGPRDMQKGNLYLFNFPLKGGRLLLLAHPDIKKKTFTYWRRRRKYRKTRSYKTWGLTAVFLDEDAVAELSRRCRSDGGSECPSGDPRLTALRNLIYRYTGRGINLRIQYVPEFDPDYRRLLSLSPKRITPLYFYSALGRGSGGTKIAGRVLQGAGCSRELEPPMNGETVNFSETFGGRNGEQKGGIWLWPLTLDEGRAKNGSPRPVYLRHFQCGQDTLRFWEMDRFSSFNSPALIVFRRRLDDPILNRAFARHFAEKGNLLLETGGEPGARGSGSGELLKEFSLQKNGLSIREIMRLYRKRHSDFPSLRLILPTMLIQ